MRVKAKRFGLSRIIASSILLVILIAAALGVLLELRLVSSSQKGSAFVDSAQFLNDTFFGYLLNYPRAKFPVGIASYGVYNYSGSHRSYSINSSEVVGDANISSIGAYTTWNDSIDTPHLSAACVYCATLQMNVNALVQTKHGEQVLWIQNVLAFSNTEARKAHAYGLIFNMTMASSYITTEAIGNGYW